MITNEQILYRFDDYRFESISFQLKEKPIFDEFTIEGNIDAKIGYQKDLKSCQVKMSIDLFPEESDGPFSLKATIVGKFSFKESLTEQQIQNFIKFNGIGTLTPYLRSAITDITKVANVAPMILPYINPSQFELSEFQIGEGDNIF
ncbi:protein-export chaperone SecB [Proteiniclasticum sp. QWL-01]|uniref:protein-export chaperone SecB n=1 Tax=Proteiniclasticum sp. QWL-01 TaxID=3036945 RepID=UPI00240FFDBC|nr:protein-export chaperone SecB [Proteiniclasticum sp. QWL-01]WFF71989.1 protein-export chaperone SecB [Proteiniclasticum sp. QWL-01]